MNSLGPVRSQIVVQTRYQFLVSVRSPVGMFFTLVLPTVMLVLFNSLFGDGTVDTGEGSWSIQQFYTGGLAAFTAVSATYTNLVNVVPIRRDEGILKRWRSTPVSPVAYLGGWVLSALTIAAIGVAVQLSIGVVFYDLVVDAGTVAVMVPTFAVGVASFAVLGLAVAGLVPDADSAPAVANATILPLAFVSDVFIPLDDPPRWLDVVGDVFPLKPFVNAFQDTVNPLVDSSGPSWADLGYVAVWGVVGGLVALRTFTWEPSGKQSRRSRRRRPDHANA